MGSGRSKEVWIQEVTRQARGGCLVGITRFFPCTPVLSLGLLAVRLMDDEGEEARCRGQGITNIWLVGPLTLTQESIDPRLRWLNGTEGWRQHAL